MGCASSSAAAAPGHASAPHGNANPSTAAVVTQPTDEHAGNAPGNPLHLPPTVSPSAAAFLSVSTPRQAYTGATPSLQLDHSLVSAALGSAAPLQDVGSATFASGTPPFARRRHRAAPPGVNRRHTTPRGMIRSDADHHHQPPGSESSYQSRASTVVLLTPDVLARHTASWTVSTRLGDSNDFDRDHHPPPPPIRVWQEDVSRWWTVIGEGVPGDESPPCRLSASSVGLAASAPPIAAAGRADPDDCFEMPPAAVGLADDE